jgi:hypothetical protein
MSRCDEKFHEWFSEEYAKLPEGEDFPVDDEFMYKVWIACWKRAYGVGLAHGQNQMIVHYRQKESRKIHRMPDVVMRETFNKSITAHEFGRAIERWHGITGEEKF